ncbi:hypothetical protein [Flavobacterium sp. HTF]|uniref:hypothetical protein n=1 Tax=Flavobacterium sp. HTF TaxID=2170732 RepID=UPI000D5CF02C|nr:hypothetical protein [Flavobacterium sp. HTF]PWB25428.1 hypothetical protein DCO46_08705 [Flavobacterium sp. HTF]
MKKLLLFVLIIISIKAQAQFPGNHPELLLNKEVKVLPLADVLQQYGYRNFHKNNEMKIVDKPIKHDLLADKTFKVTEITPFEKYGSKKFILKLESGKDAYYYEYDPKHDYEYNLEAIGGLQLPEGIYCEDIKTETDKFTGEVRANSPYSEGFSFMKTIKDGKTTIYLAVNEAGATANVGGKGLFLLLSNGKKIEKPNAPIDVKVNKGAKGFLYSAFVPLTTEDIKLLTENQITDNRLYIYDGTVKNGQKLSEYLKCLSK